MPRSRKQRIWIIVAAIASATGAAAVLFVLVPFLRSTKNFLPYAGDARVRFEPGAEPAAAIVARALPDAIATVERSQFSRFPKPVEVYVCARMATFDRYAHHAEGAGGFVLNGRLFISPKSQNTAERLPRLLVHELSHLHLEQHLGLLGLARRVPNWFKEGIAVNVAQGAGAETVTESQAREAIAAGRVFRLDVKGSLFSPQTGARDGLPAHMFYRQSAMFVDFLARHDPIAFAKLVGGIQERQRFADAITRVYASDVGVLWNQFLAELKDPSTGRAR